MVGAAAARDAASQGRVRMENFGLGDDQSRGVEQEVGAAVEGAHALVVQDLQDDLPVVLASGAAQRRLFEALVELDSTEVTAKMREALKQSLSFGA